jgi:alpha-glucosidase
MSTLARLQNTLAHAWNEEFLSNPRPSLGDSVVFRLRLPKDLSWKYLSLFAIINGADHRLPLKRSELIGSFQFYSVEMPVNQPKINYCFHLVDHDNQTYYLTRNKVSFFPQTEDHDWIIIADLAYPEWVRHSVFYQIFPDRFARGNPIIGVKSGEFFYNNGQAIAMEWHQKPLQYPEGRCLDFFNGDLEGIRQQIPYLKDLGVNALYLNPIFTARTNHKYDCIDFFSIDPHLGGDKALIELIEDLHANGIRIILDISINHTGSDHIWFRRAKEDPHSQEAEYYYSDGKGNFFCWFDVPTLPQLNYTSQKLRDIMYRGESSVIHRYLQPPFSIDGWRFDVGNHTAKRNSDQLGHEVFREVREEIKGLNPQIYIVGENWEDSREYLQGDQWDGTMNYYPISRAIRRFFGEMDRYVMGHEHNALRSPALFGEDFVTMVRDFMDRIPNPLLDLQFNLMGSHDVSRFYLNKDLISEKQYWSILCYLFLLPGTPSVYYGDETGLTGEIDSNEGCRYPMNWDEKSWNTERREFIKTLINLKKSSTVLQRGAFRFFDFSDRAVGFLRYFQGEAFLSVLNRGAEGESLRLPEEYGEIVEAQALAGELSVGFAQSRTLVLSQDSVFLIKLRLS